MIGPGYMLYGLLLPTWFAMVGWKVLHLDRGGHLMSRVRGPWRSPDPVEGVFDAVADQRNEPSSNPTMTAATTVSTGRSGSAPSSRPLS